MKYAVFSSILMIAFAMGVQEIDAAPVEARVATPRTASPQVKTPSSEAYSSGKVKSIDWDQGKVLITHGPIDNLGMPSMTMLFRVSERSLLKNLNTGDTVQFKAEKNHGTLFIVEIVRQ